MWWCRHALLIAAVAILGGALGGCGFRSLYGKQSAVQAAEELQRIKIQPIEDWIGQVVHNHLLDLLNPGGRPARPNYELRVILNETTSKLAVERNAFATRANLNLQAKYQLVDARSGRQLYSSNDVVIGSYNLYDSDYATLAAAKDARRRAAREVGQIIRAKLAAYFSQRHDRTGERS